MKPKVVLLTGHGLVPRKAIADTCSIRSRKSHGDLANPTSERPGTSRGPRTPGSINDKMSIDTNEERILNLPTSRPGTSGAPHTKTSHARFVDTDSK